MKRARKEAKEGMSRAGEGARESKGGSREDSRGGSKGGSREGRNGDISKPLRTQKWNIFV